ncbi:sensor histidine kinase [Clostridiales bacterium COT073_COT-073]|nr:sensor histidine kinase [Clostridiales bacterium COT073_COT-073]
MIKDQKKLSPPTVHQLFWQQFTKMFLPILFVSVLMGVIAGLLFWRDSANKMVKNNHNMLLQAQSAIDITMSNVDAVALALTRHTYMLRSIHDILEGEFGWQERQEIQRFYQYISSISYSNPYLFSVYVYVENPRGCFISSTDEKISDIDSYYDKNWYKTKPYRNGEKIWAERRSIQRYDFEKAVAVISIYRAIDPFSPRNTGVVVGNVEERQILSLLEPLQFMEGQQLVVQDANGNILFSYPETENPLLFSEAYRKQYIVDQIKSRRFGWTYTSAIPKKLLFSSVRSIIGSLTVVLLAGLLFSTVIGILVARRRYKSALSAIDFVNAGGKVGESFLPLWKRDDIYDYFMQKTLTDYAVSQELERQIWEQAYQLRTMELVALQAQINPHFLFNTLEVIKWESISLTGGGNSVSQMLENLAAIIRYSISDPRETVSLQREVDLARIYVEILMFRYAGKFNVEWRLGSDLEQYKVPKLILQPLIENAVYHGVKEKKEFSVIRIRIHRHGKKLLIIVMDNGVGIERPALEKLKKQLQAPEDFPSDSVGLLNVSKRIALLYGDRWNMKIFSKKGKGTFLKIEILLKEEDEDTDRKYSVDMHLNEKRGKQNE